MENNMEHKKMKTQQKKNKPVLGAVFAMLCSFMVVFATVTVSVPNKAHAQTCETQAEISGAQALMIALQDAAIGAVQTAVSNFVTGLINGVLGNLMPFLDAVDNTVRTEMGELWSDWLPGMHDMMKQLNTAGIDKTRIVGDAMGAIEQGRAQRQISDREIAATKNFRVSDEMCIVDTVNPSQLRADVAANAMRQAKEVEFYDSGIGLGGMGSANTIASEGKDAVINAEFSEYMTAYKDDNLNAGMMLPGPPSVRAGNQFDAAKNFFGVDTIDLTAANTRQDIDVNTRLLIGRQTLPPLDSSVTNTAQGRQEILKRRQYQARLNTYAGAFSDIVGNRTPGAANANLQAMQLANGRPASEINPQASYEEHKRARIQHLWTPRYMNELNDTKHTAVQKQIDLYMMKTMELQDIIRKTERIGLIFSSRLGQRLDQTTIGSRGEGSKVK